LFRAVVYLVDFVGDFFFYRTIKALLFGTFSDFVLDIVCSIAQCLHGFTQSSGDFRDFIGAKDHNHYKENKRDFWCANKPKHELCYHAANIVSVLTQRKKADLKKSALTHISFSLRS